MSSVNIVWEAVSEKHGDRFKPEERKEAPSQLFSALLKTDLPIGQNFNPRHLAETVNLDAGGIAKSMGAPQPSPAQFKKMVQSYQENLAAFDTQLGKVFRSNNISTNPPPALKINVNGQVTVAGSHPDAQKIESLFESDAELRSGLTALGHAAAKLRAAEIGTAASPLGPLAQIALNGERIKQDVERRAAGRYASPSDTAPQNSAIDHKA